MKINLLCKLLKCGCDKCQLASFNVALPMYKSNSEDEYAGESGKNEFKKEKDIVARSDYLSFKN